MSNYKFSLIIHICFCIDEEMDIKIEVLISINFLTLNHDNRLSVKFDSPSRSEGYFTGAPV